MPCSIALLAGVFSGDLGGVRGRLARTLEAHAVPADDQEIVLPCASVMVMIVLLKDAFTWATPDDDVFAFLASWTRGGFGATRGGCSCFAMIRLSLDLLRHFFLAGDRPLRGLCGCVRWCGCAGRGPAGRLR